MNAKLKTNITSEQLRAIWTISRSIGLDEDMVRDVVEAVSGQRSTRSLSLDQASEVLTRLTNRRFAHDRARGKNKHREMDGRKGMATGAQLRKIEAMWADRARAHDKDAALRQWMSNRFGVSDIRFLGRSRASDVIVALEKMEVY